jgi:hypothetical protein
MNVSRRLSENERKRCFALRFCLQFVLQMANVLDVLPLCKARVASPEVWHPAQGHLQL